jgi:pyridinium-3,5-bisthiocarboxylic acid mononucleotide nickel chelatase
MYLDCFSGAAGDMLLAALIDAGLPVDALRSALGTLGVGHELVVRRVRRAGLAATHVEVRAERAHAGHDSAHAHHHDDDQGHDHAGHGQAHVHRSLDEIVHLIGHSSLSEVGKERAAGLFRRIAEAEATTHAMPVAEVHLHEVGATDSIIDIVGAVFALEWFGIDDIVASPLNVGSGSVEMAHGTYPVPAPATLQLLAGVPVYGSGAGAELVTPTGALLVSAYARSYGPLPAMTVEKVGYGAGTRDLGTSPNVLRVVIGTRHEVDVTGSETIVKMECEIDDMNPQLFGPLGERLLAAGALDVFLTPVLMKKGRPGTLVTVLAPEHRRQPLSDALFRETTTLGVRFERVSRDTLERRWEEVTVAGEPIRIKISGRGAEIFNAVPEFDDCLRAATTGGRAVKEVQAEALRAWFERDRH